MKKIYLQVSTLSTKLSKIIPEISKSHSIMKGKRNVVLLCLGIMLTLGTLQTKAQNANYQYFLPIPEIVSKLIYINLIFITVYL